ncbi:MAG: hypothetical protein IJX78_04525 [Bacilli bacterium]|nr:hypothetical protein [Bacilli bacterium]
MQEKFNIPQTREEAIERKEELLKKLNQYNEDYFSGNTTYTEEEINLIKEEYDFLDDYVEVDAEFVMEEATEKTFFDKVNIFVWIYALFVFFSGLYFLQQLVGFEVFKVAYTAGLFENISNILKYIGIVSCYVIYPVLLIIISIILKLFAFKKTEEDKKAFKWVFLGQIIYILINFAISYFVVIDMTYQMIKD